MIKKVQLGDNGQYLGGSPKIRTLRPTQGVYLFLCSPETNRHFPLFPIVRNDRRTKSLKSHEYIDDKEGAKLGDNVQYLRGSPKIRTLRPTQGVYLFLCSPETNRHFSLFPKTKILIFCVPYSPKLPLFPCSHHFLTCIPLFP